MKTLIGDLLGGAWPAALDTDREAGAGEPRRRDRARQHARAARLGAAPGRAVLRGPGGRHPGRVARGAGERTATPAACCTRASRSPCTLRGRAGHDRRARGRRVPAGRPGRRLLALDFGAFDAWLRGGRADLRPPARPVPPRRRAPDRAAGPDRGRRRGRGRDDTRAAAVRDQISTRFYLPREDVRAALARASGAPTARTRARPPTGRSTPAAAATDLAWSYEQPLPDARAITGLVAFWDERVDVFVDGELRAARRAARR